MKINNLLIIILLLIYSCKKNKIEDSKIIHLDTKISNQYLKTDSIGNNMLNPKDLKSIKLGKNEINFNIKENNYTNIIYNVKENKNQKFYLLKEFIYQSILYKIIIFNMFGENDAYTFNVVLYSYNKNNNHVIDALMLDCRLNPELEIFTEYEINNNLILLNHKIKDNYIYDKDASIIGRKEIAEITEEIVTYKISNDGHFIKIN